MAKTSKSAGGPSKTPAARTRPARAPAASSPKLAKLAPTKSTKSSKASTSKAPKFAKTSVKQAPAKPAREQPAPAAAKTPAKPARKQPEPTAPAKPRRRRDGNRTAGDGPLGDWVARLTAQIAALKAHPGVELLEKRIGTPGSTAGLRLIERTLGFDLDPAVRDLYLQADGVFIVWIRRGQRGMIPKRRHLGPYDLETLPPGAGVIHLAPAHAVFGKPGPTRMDYAKYMPGEPPHWGFDFPGNYYTPAFVRDGDGLKVKVGSDHGAAWDGPAVSLERYMEVVLATWGSVQARAEAFVRGRGAAIRPMTLDQVLAKYRD